MKLTDWYPPHVKPMREGLYQIGSDTFWVLGLWKKGSWRHSLNPKLKHKEQDWSWRGIAK